MIFANGVKLDKYKTEQLKKISGDQNHDRAYVNKFFAMIYSDRYMNKLTEQLLTREKILERLRESKRCAVLKGTLQLFSFQKLK